MAKRILVPIDFSDATDIIVPIVTDLAAGAGGSVRLLHVAPVPESLVNDEGRVIAYVDQEMARLEADAVDAMRVLEAQMMPVPVELVVRFGDPAREIVAEAEVFCADLVALTSRGRRRRLGDVTARVLKAAPWLPALVLRPSSIAPPLLRETVAAYLDQERARLEADAVDAIPSKEVRP